MIVLPGPALVVLPAGLALLATEFVWARRLLRRIGKQVGDARNSFRKMMK
jgi:tellurite resistance protein TerC